MKEKQVVKERSPVLVFLIHIYRGQARRIGAIIILLFLLSAASAILPKYSAQIIDDGFVRGEMGTIIRTALLILIISGVTALLHIVIEFVRLKGYNDVQTELKKKTLDKLMRVDYSYYNKRTAPEVYQQFDEDIVAISGGFSSEIMMSLVSVTVALFLIPVLISISWKLFLIMLLAVPAELLKTKYFSRIGYRLSKKRLSVKKRYSAWMADVVSGNSTIRSFGLEPYFYQLFIIRQHEVADTQVRQGMVTETLTRLEAFLVDLLTFIIYIVGGYLTVGGEVSLGEFVAFEAYSFNILSLTGQVMGLFLGYSILKPSVERFMAFMDEKDEDAGEGEPVDGFRAIQMKAVSFSYDTESKVIRDVNLQIVKGDHVAIAGDNGCGKTTLINLLLRVITPDAGEITLNDKDSRCFDANGYRRLFTVAPQNPFLFCDSIRNNVTFYRDDISEDKIRKALEQVGLNSLVDEKGLDYTVGQNGCELSGGQRQRLSLARTLLSDAPIVILDEPETSLDQGLDELFSSLVGGGYRERTLIVISHHPDIVAKMEKAFVLKQGMIYPWRSTAEDEE